MVPRSEFGKIAQRIERIDDGYGNLHKFKSAEIHFRFNAIDD